MKKLFKILIGIFLFLCVCAAGAAYLLIHPAGLPEDQDLIANFEKNREGFEELIKMIRHDPGLQVVDETWTSPPDPSSVGVTAERVKVYKEMFKKINIPRGFTVLESSWKTQLKVDLTVEAVGMVPAGASKGYSYLEVPPSTNVVGKLDGIDDTGPGDHKYYRHISGAWYLFYEYD